MHKLFHFYNQNRKDIWMVVIVIIFAFTIIQILNQFSIQKHQEEAKIPLENITNEEKSYENESKSIISGGSVSDNYSKDFGKIIDQFFTYCIEGQPQKAYGLLSSTCKKVLYPSQAIFEEQYYQKRFTKNKTYSFQSWSTKKHCIYIVKVFDNMLITGKDNTSNYVEDYVTIVKENDEYKLNINGFIDQRKLRNEKENDGILIKLQSSNIFMEEQEFTVKVTNNTDKVISITPENVQDSIYIVDENNISFSCFINEISKEDLIIESGKTKSIKLRFNNSYRDGIKINKIVFDNIIRDYEQYQREQGTNKEKCQIEIEI